MSIVIFNFESNKNSQALAFSIDWVNEISKNVDKLYVVSLRCGEYCVKENVNVFCVEQNMKNKIQTIFEIWRILKNIHKKDKNINGYFIHMAHYFVPIIYPFAKLYHQKIVLWYAHKSTPLSLKIANFFSDTILTSTATGYQIQTKKLKIIGQGVNLERFCFKTFSRDTIKNIAIVGRISRIKNIHIAIDSFIAIGQSKNDIFLYIVGDVLTDDDREYFEYIKKKIPENIKHKIIFTSLIPFERLPQFYQDIDLSINLSDTGSLDKTILEAMAMGIGVVTSNDSAKRIFNFLDGNGVYLLDEKGDLMECLKNIINNGLKFDRLLLRKEIEQNHSIGNLVKKIVGEFFCS